MVRCDVLVAGGGPAGLAVAIALRQKGVDVLVADPIRPPIEKACGEGLMPDAQQDLAALGVPVDASDGAHFHGIHFLSATHDVFARFAQGTGVGIRRLRLHEKLVERCRDLGVRFAWGRQARAFQDQLVTLDGARCSFRYAIGADGQSSQIRKAIGLGEGKILSRRFGARCHYRIQPWSEMVEVHWSSLGQAYITPVGADQVCVATVSRSSEMRSEAVIDSLPSLRDRLRQAAVSTRMRGALTTTRVLRRVAASKIALVGDASGSADAVTGEGLALSFRQAHSLANAIVADDLSLYQERHPKIMRMPVIMSQAMLAMDRSIWVRKGALSLLSANPALFAFLLRVHLGHGVSRRSAASQAGLLQNPQVPHVNSLLMHSRENF